MGQIYLQCVICLICNCLLSVQEAFQRLFTDFRDSSWNGKAPPKVVPNLINRLPSLLVPARSGVHRVPDIPW